LVKIPNDGGRGRQAKAKMKLISDYIPIFICVPLGGYLIYVGVKLLIDTTNFAKKLGRRNIFKDNFWSIESNYCLHKISGIFFIIFAVLIIFGSIRHFLYFLGW
jgi:hypothetical protein